MAAGVAMHRFVAKANVDHYIGLLNGSDLAPGHRTSITKLLIEEEDKLSHDLEHLEFAEQKAANGRDHVRCVRAARDGFAFGTADRELAERLLVNCENLQTVLEDFCHSLRAKINSQGL